MKHSKRGARLIAVSVATAAAAALALTGCSTATPGSAGHSTTTLRVLANITPVLTKAYYQDLVSPWVKAHPGVKVQIEVPSGTNVQTTFQQELASGSVPDVLAGNVDTTVIPQLVTFPNAKWVTSTPLAQEDKVNGKIWQVATGEQIKSLVYFNKDAFAKAGITDLPKSLDDFTTDLGKLKAAGYVGLQTAGEWVTGAQFSMAADPLALADTPDWFAQANKGTVTFAGSAFETYLSDYSGWIKSGVVPKDSLGVKYADSITEFTSGKSAMYIMGNWAAPSIDGAKLTFKAGVFPTPTIDGSPSKQLANQAQPYMIPKASKNQALAMSLVKYLVTDKTAITKSLKSEGNSRKGYTYPSTPLVAAIGQILTNAPGSVIEPVDQMPAGYSDELNTIVQSLYTGTSASDAAKKLDSWWSQNAVK